MREYLFIGGRNMSRTGEVVLGVVSAIFTFLSIIMTVIFIVGGSNIFTDELFIAEFEQEIYNDPTLSEFEAQETIDIMTTIFEMFTVLGWLIVVAMIISLVLNIIGIVSVSKNKNPKLAGIMFIIAGVFAGLLSLTSILLYIAAIMCFVRKPPVQPEEEYYTPSQPL